MKGIDVDVIPVIPAVVPIDINSIGAIEFSCYSGLLIKIVVEVYVIDAIAICVYEVAVDVVGEVPGIDHDDFRDWF